jgi:hypothetical protein
MCDVLISLPAGMTSTLRARASLQVEILALRHQLAVLQRTKRRRVSIGTADPDIDAVSYLPEQERLTGGFHYLKITNQDQLD